MSKSGVGHFFVAVSVESVEQKRLAKLIRELRLAGLRFDLGPEVSPLARADDTNAMTEARREVFEIAGDKKIGGSIYRKFKKLSVGGIDQLHPR